MAVVPGATVSSDVANAINSEYLDRLIQQPNRPIPVWMAIAEVVTDTGVWKSNTFTRAKWTAAAVANTFSSPKAETDEFVSQVQAMTQVTGNGAVMGTRKTYPDEAQQDMIVDMAVELLFQSEAEVDQQVDTDVLSLITSANNTENNSGAALSVAIIDTALAALRALEPNNLNIVSTLAHKQIQDLRTNIKAQTGAVFGGALGDQAAPLFNGRAAGFISRWQGIEFIESGNVPQFDANNHAGGLFIAGTGGAFLVPVWWPARSETERKPSRVATHLITSMRHSLIVNEQNHLIEIVTAK